jgi:catechol 2,3-dioxygenase-like lactoylglutathione lyase family enzyme
MAKIRHVAIMSADHERLARFYTEVIGLEEVSRGGNPPGNTIYLTDGETGLAVIGTLAKGDAAPPPGVNHIGFWVEDLDKMKDWLRSQEGELKVEERPSLALHGQYFESKFLDPEGFSFDVSESGWPGTKEAKEKAAEAAKETSHADG